MTPEFTFTRLTPELAPAVAAFPGTAAELFYMFPRGTFPFTAGQLLEIAATRYNPTVCLLDGQPAGYAVFRKLLPGVQATIGNVVTNPALRRRGVCSALMNHMIDLARGKYGVETIHLAVFNTNTAAILLYHRLGFKPTRVREWVGSDGRTEALLIMDRPALRVHS